jgi:hypothetical protein
MLHGSYEALRKKILLILYAKQTIRTLFSSQQRNRTEYITRYSSALRRLKKKAKLSLQPRQGGKALRMITPAPSGRIFPDPNRQFTETSPVPLRNLQRDINPELANRNNPNHQSTMMPPVPLQSPQRNIDSGLANQNHQQAYKTKYGETVLRL